MPTSSRTRIGAVSIHRQISLSVRSTSWPVIVRIVTVLVSLILACMMLPNRPAAEMNLHPGMRDAIIAAKQDFPTPVFPDSNNGQRLS